MRSSLQNLAKLKSQKGNEIEDIYFSLRSQRAVLATLNHSMSEKKQGLTVQKSLDIPEMTVWEQILGSKIAGTGRLGHLRVEFHTLKTSREKEENCFFIFRLTPNREYQGAPQSL